MSSGGDCSELENSVQLKLLHRLAPVGCSPLVMKKSQKSRWCEPSYFLKTKGRPTSVATSLQTLLLPNQSLSFPVSAWHLMIPGRQEAVNMLLAHQSVKFIQRQQVWTCHRTWNSWCNWGGLSGLSGITVVANKKTLTRLGPVIWPTLSRPGVEGRGGSCF